MNVVTELLSRPATYNELISPEFIE